MKTKIYIKLTYLSKNNKKEIDSIFSSYEFNGIIYGSEFCDNYTFQLEEFDRKKELFYNTPIFITSRNSDQIYQNIVLLNQISKKFRVIIHDFGLLQELKLKGMIDLVILGRFFFNRQFSFNKHLLNMLIGEGIKSIEIDAKNFGKIRVIKQNNFETFYQLFHSKIVTFARSCYLRTITGKDCTPKSRLCEKMNEIKLKNPYICLDVGGHHLFLGFNQNFNKFLEYQQYCDNVILEFPKKRADIDQFLKILNILQ